MKKIYLLASFLGAGLFAFGQVQKAPQPIKKNTEKMVSSYGMQKAPGDTIWTSDFSDPSDWVIDGDGLQGTWVIGTIDDLEYPQYYFEIESSTVDNGFAFFEGVGFLIAEAVNTQNAWIEMANSVDLSAYDIVTLKFEQSYRAFNHDVTYVEVSLDGGTTWEQAVDVNADVPTNTSTDKLVIVQNFNVNQSDEVKFRFRWFNGNDDNQYGSGYAWQVDDVLISSLADNDLQTRSLTYGSTGSAPTAVNMFYKQIPLAQVAPINSSVVVDNIGTNVQTGVGLQVNEVEYGDYSSLTNPLVDVEPGDTAVLTVADAFTPPAIGEYTLEYQIISDQEDDVPTNNVLNPYTFTVGEHIYARDGSSISIGESFTSSYSYMSGANSPDPDDWSAIEAGNAFNIFQTADLYSIDFVLGDVIADGALVFGHILDENLEQLPGGETIQYTASIDETGSYIQLLFENPVTLTPGEYVATVTSFEQEFSIATSGVSAPQTSFVWYADDNTWYYTTSTPIVRLNFDETVSIKENKMNELGLTQYPNPFSNETTVKFTLKDASEVSYTVVDVTGKVVANVTEGQMMAGVNEITIDGSSFANGVYYLNLTAGNSNVTHKMVVNK